MNHLAGIGILRNRYFAMRHGHSRANELGIIVSDPRHGLDEYGLSARGRAQVEALLAGGHGLGADTLILSSDFRRARETAEIVHARLGCRAAIALEPRLRERFFGEFELDGDDAYAEVWRADARDADNVEAGVESPNAVMARVTAVIADCETRVAGREFLLVSHGDALQILLTAFAAREASNHREIRHLDTAEVRPLTPAGIRG